MQKLKILIVDDSFIYRKILSRIVDSIEFSCVVNSVANGSLAMEWLAENEVDVVLLDIIMPGENGITILGQIKKLYPNIEVIMISGGGPNSAENVIEALKLGALDFILKPTEMNADKNMEIINNNLQFLFSQIKSKKLVNKSRVIIDNEFLKDKQDVKIQQNKIQPIKYNKKISNMKNIDLVLIASSTGGPVALGTVLSGFKDNFDKPILVVQHMPVHFTNVLAESLDKKCRLTVTEGKEGDLVMAGHILIAPGGYHMKVVSNGGLNKKISMETSPCVNGVRPAADVLFSSVAKLYEGCNVLAVILTGMGSDGMKGVEELKKACNCYCITQSESTCVVYGMPRSVYDAGLSDEVVDIQDISLRIAQIVMS